MKTMGIPTIFSLHVLVLYLNILLCSKSIVCTNAFAGHGKVILRSSTFIPSSKYGNDNRPILLEEKESENSLSRTRLYSETPRTSRIQKKDSNVSTKSQSTIQTYSQSDKTTLFISDEDKEAEAERPFSEYATILSLCWFVALLSALDRVAMSVAILPLSAEYHLTDGTKGAISSVFSVGYGLGIIPAGLLVSSMSPRIIMACGVLLWSLATFGTPLAANLIHVDISDDELKAGMTIVSNIAPLLFIRSVMGAAESVVWPTIQKVLQNWVPTSQKSTSVATIHSGFQIGTLLAYLLSPYVMGIEGVGWRGLFYLYGAIGALWLIPWWLLAKDSPDYATKLLSKSTTRTLASNGNDKSDQVLLNELKEQDSYFIIEQRLIDENGEEALEVGGKDITSWEEATGIFKDAPWKEIMTSKATWAMTVAHAASNWGLYNMLSWNPTFYAEQYGLNVKESAFLSILPSVAGAMSGLVAGYAADKILGSYAANDDDQKSKTTQVRKGFQSLALFGPAACLFTMAYHIPDDPTFAQFLLTGTVGLQAFSSAGYSAACQEKAGEKWAGLLYSLTTLPGVVFGSVGVYVTGQMLDFTDQNWAGVFGLNGVVDILGGLAFVALYNSRKEFE